VEQNYRDARLLTIGEGASEILRFAIARPFLDSVPMNEEIVPPLETLEMKAGPTLGVLRTSWNPSLKALHLARQSFQTAVERMRMDDSLRFSSTRQTTAVAVADLAAKLWIASQVVQACDRFGTNGVTSTKALNFGKSFVDKTCLEICRQSLELLRWCGVADDRLLANYSAVLKITPHEADFESGLPQLIAERRFDVSAGNDAVPSPGDVVL